MSVLILIGLVAFIVTCLILIGIDWSRFFGSEIVEKNVEFGKPLTGKEVAELFTKVVETLKRTKRFKRSAGIIFPRDFYSICSKGFENNPKQWTTWQPIDRFREHLTDEYSCRFRTSWVIQVESNSSVMCFVHNSDRTLFHEDITYNRVKLTCGFKICKAPWNKKRLERQKEFVNQITSITNNLLLQ